MRALIVEDNIEQAWQVRNALSQKGIEADTCGTLNEATSMVLGKAYDLVVLDLFLPDGVTTSLSHLIRMRYPETSILGLTGKNVFSRGEHTDIMSVDYMLHKPVSPQDVGEIASYLAQSPPPESQPESCHPW